MQWHLSRDNCLQLSKFCEKHAVKHENETDTFKHNGMSYFEHTYHFDNGGFIKAEMLQGDTRSYSVADHFQVVDYKFN
jgi:hypothetical protein